MENDTTIQSLTDKTGDDFDKAFIAAMAIHHNKAIEMAKIAQKNGKRKEILDLAENIISAQTKENEQIKIWQSEWKLANT